MAKIDKKESGFPNSDAILNKAFRNNNNNNEIQSWCLWYYAQLFHRLSSFQPIFYNPESISTSIYSLPCAHTPFCLSLISIKLLSKIP